MRILAALLAVSASLHVTIWPSGHDGKKTTWSLGCSPAGGTLPHRTTACRRLSRLVRPFAPVPRDVACTDIYGGPELARVTGRFRGGRVDASFNRRNGCEIERWNTLSFLLGTPGSR